MSASGQRTALRVAPESAFGVTDGSTFKAIRITDTSLNLQKATFQSNEIRSDRQRADLRHGMRSVAGNVNVELGLSTFDDLLEAGLAGAWEDVSTGSASLGAAAPDEVTRASGSFLDDGLLPGDEVVLSGFTESANNGRAKVVAVSASSLTLDKSLVLDAAAAGREVALVGKRIKAGTLLKTLTFERAFLDVNQFLLFTGCAVDQMSISIQPEEIVTADFSFLGKDMEADGVTAASSVTPAADNSPFDAFTGSLSEGGVVIGNVTGVDIEVSNGRQTQGVIGHNTAQEIFEGSCEVSGTVTAMFSNLTLLDKFINEDASSLDITLVDPNGTDFHRINIPRLKYTGGELDNPAEGPVILTLPFTGTLDPVAGTSIIYQRSNA